MEKIRREERDPVQRVAVEIEDGQGQRKRHRDRQQHHARFAPAQRQRDEQRHRERGNQEMLEQFVRFFLGRFTVVARDGDI